MGEMEGRRRFGYLSMIIVLLAGRSSQAQQYGREYEGAGGARRQGYPNLGPRDDSGK